MAYTPYSQALPDTSRYTLDPVLQERLYQPVRPDPYQAGMLSTMAKDYYADPIGYTNRRFGKLDEVLETDKPEVGLGGMFAPPPPQNTGGGDSASDTGGRNYYQELEDRLTELNISEDGMDPEDARDAAIKSAFAIQSANNKPINDALTSLSKLGVAGLFSQLIGGGLRPAGQNVPNVNKNSNELARQQLQSNLTAQNTRNLESAAIAKAEAEKAAAIQAAAAEAARAANPFSMVAYNDSARTGDWGWFDNASSGQQDSIISNFERSDAAGNAAAASTGYYGAGDI